jgi:hypothetical protein
MRTALLLATITTPFALATGGTLIAPAGLAAADSAIETIGLLEAEGYTVNIDRVGSAPLDRVERGSGHGDGDHRDFDLVPVVVSRSISVSLNCAV